MVQKISWPTHARRCCFLQFHVCQWRCRRMGRREHHGLHACTARQIHACTDLYEALDHFLEEQDQDEMAIDEAAPRE